MRIVFTWVICMLFLIEGCSNKTTSKIFGDEIKGYRIIHSVSPAMGLFNPDLKRSDTAEAKIFFWKDQVIYFASHVNYYSKDGIRADKIEKQEFVFVHSKNSDKGYYYDVFRQSQARIVDVDSFLRFEWFAQIKIYPIFLVSDNFLISKKSGDNGKEEMYQLKGRGEDSSKMGSSTLLYDNKIRDNRISLSKELDSLSKMKLIRVKTITNARFIPGPNINLPRFEIAYWLEEINDEKEIKEAATYIINYKRRE